MKWKILSVISFLLIIPVIVIWQVHSKQYGQTLMFSREKIEIKTKYIDEVFGTEVVKSEWKEGFWLGLLPPTDSISLKIMYGVVPLSCLFIALGIGFIIIHFVKKKKITQTI